MFCLSLFLYLSLSHFFFSSSRQFASWLYNSFVFAGNLNILSSHLLTHSYQTSVSLLKSKNGQHFKLYIFICFVSFIFGCCCCLFVSYIITVQTNSDRISAIYDSVHFQIEIIQKCSLVLWLKTQRQKAIEKESENNIIIGDNQWLGFNSRPSCVWILWFCLQKVVQMKQAKNT